MLILCALGFALLADTPASRPGESTADRAPEKAVGVPADFKVSITLYGAGKEPQQKTDLVVHDGRSYLFDPGPPLEVLIHDPMTGRLELINLVAKIRSEVTFQRLDEFQAKLHSAITSAASKREAQGGKANQIAAQMSRELINPQFKVTDGGLEAPRIQLDNSTVEVEGTGEPETDPARLASLHAALARFTKLDATRDPAALPPFPKLEALRALMIERRLRPTELVFVYRLTGAPFKMRWTFRMVPSLTPRELEAIARVEGVREQSRFVRFDRYRFNETRGAGRQRSK